MKNTKNNTKTTATETVSERKWTPEVISAALENGAKPEGMSNTYWYKLRKKNGVEIVRQVTWDKEVIAEALNAGVKPEGMSNTYWYRLRKRNGIEIVRTRKNKGEKEPKAEKPAKEEKPAKVEKTAKEIELEARRANRAAKKAAEKKTK